MPTAFGARALGTLLLLGLVRPAAAEEPPVQLELTTCAPGGPSSSELEQAVRLELLGVWPRPKGTASERSWLRIELRCHPQLEARVQVRGANGRDWAERSFLLSDTPEPDRSRTIALIAAELLLALGARGERDESEHSRQPAASASFPGATQPELGVPASRPRPRSVKVPEPSSRRRAASRPSGDERALTTSERSVRFEVGARARWYLEYSNLAVGGHLGFTSGRLRPRLEVLWLSARGEPGTVSLGTATAGLGFVFWTGQRAGWRLDAGLTLALGATWAVAEATQPGVVAHDHVAAYAEGRVDVRVSRQIAGYELFATGELGRAAGVEHRAGGDRVAALAGWISGIELGAAF